MLTSDVLRLVISKAFPSTHVEGKLVCRNGLASPAVCTGPLCRVSWAKGRRDKETIRWNGNLSRRLVPGRTVRADIRLDIGEITDVRVE